MKKSPLLLAATLAGLPAPAFADRFVQDPTAGVSLPVTPLAGDHDATSVVVNPGGLPFLGGAHLEAVFTGLENDRIDATGTGFGVYAASPVQLPFGLPRLGMGLSVEKLLPPRIALAPDPGTPLRLSLAWSYGIDKDAGIGLAVHHFVDPDSGGALDGLTTFDLGMSWRLGRYAALGLVARDLFAPTVGGVTGERIYDGEAVLRPFGDDRLEVALGAAVGEQRGGVDPRLIASLRLHRGLYLRGGIDGRTLFRLNDPAFPDGDTTRVWEARATLGLEVSFGELGAGAYATGSLIQDGDAHLGGGTAIARWSEERLPAVQASAAYIARLKIGAMDGERGLASVINRMHRIEEDGAARAVFVHLDGVAGGWATLQELRQAIQRLRAHGKKVVAYMVAGTTRDYYVAAACDKIYLDAAGGLRLVGLSSTSLFFKETFDKLGVVAQFEKIEEYKSAPEAFTRTTSTEPARAMHEELLADTWDQLIGDLAGDRKKTPAEVKKMFDDGPYTAEEAGKAGIVDAVVEPVQIDELLAKDVGGDLDVAEGPPVTRPVSWEYPQIAVVILEGDIVDGKSVEVPLLGQRMAGGETIASAIAWARANPRVAAIVLRINSPGGSALASEVIAREVFETRGKKPIIVSMGDVAASGGYFSAAPGDLIYAEPGTITGSIGIFTGKFDLSGLLGTLGLTWETQKRGAHADMESYFRAYTDEERKLVKQKLRYFYMRFVHTVARGRGMTDEQVDAVGRGRVWSGTRAKAHNLFDREGGLVDAILEAKRRGGLGQNDRAELLFLPLEPEGIVAKLLKLAGGQTDDVLALPAVREALRALPGSLLLAPSGSVQARMPFSVTIE